jgi:uncharacterized protein YcbK (DUF882 family)
MASGAAGDFAHLTMLCFASIEWWVDKHLHQQDILPVRSFGPAFFCHTPQIVVRRCGWGNWGVQIAPLPIPVKFQLLSTAVCLDGGASVGAGGRRIRGVRNKMGSRVPASSVTEFLTAILPSRIGQCAGLAALIILLGDNGLETAAANGDTRTLSLHHIHTDEDITITYKRDGRFDEEALKRLDHFVRDWRKDEEVHLDPRLLDVIWEVSREVGGGKTIHVVCGYRSPLTNAMLRRRSSGVARFSQHTVGKAMDFYIPGAPLEELRDAGLRLQRGGVGYYPSSGSPFVHLDVGSVRHWPRMTHDQLARVFPNGRTVHVPSDGHPLSGYAQALADIEKRGSSAPSQTSLTAAAAGVDAASVRGAHNKSLFASWFHTDEEEDDTAQAASGGATLTTLGSRAGSFSLASADTKAEPARTALVPVPAARPQQAALASVLVPTANKDAASAPATADKGRWAVAFAEPLRPPAQAMPRAPLSNPDSAPALTPWPIRDADKDRVPLDMLLAYAAQPQRDRGADFGRAELAQEDSIRAVAASNRTAELRQSNTEAPKKSAAAVPIIHVKVVVQTATPGMRYDDPWLRAIILAPRLYGAMTATLYGEPDFTELRALMKKPTTSIAMSFTNEPYPGITANSFSGEAVVLLNTYAFSQRTAWLQ